ncbi:MAG: hypothetical protein ACRDZ8_09150 [Acidimicrobiales bacterium]
MLPTPAPFDRHLPAPAPAAAKAAISPTALVLAGGGTVAAAVIGLPVVAAVAVGVCLWGIRVGGGAAVAAARRSAAARPELIDPYAVPEPWRSFVRESVTAQNRFDQTVARTKPGPLQETLSYASSRVHEATRECFRVAHLGAALDAARATLDPEATSAALRRLQQAQTPGWGPRLAPPGGTPATEDTEAALAARLQAARRLEATGQRARDRLGVLTAQLHTAVAGAVELSLEGASPQSATRLSGSVDTLVGEIETLRRALEETHRTHPMPQ